MEQTYTVAKILKVADVEGKYGPQKRTAFTTNETGEKILSAFSKYELKEGQQLNGTISETEKDGKTYHNFSFAKKAAAGMSPEQFETIMRELRAINANILRVWGEVDPQKGMTSAGTPVPDFTPATMNGGYSDADFEEFKAEDVAF